MVGRVAARITESRRLSRAQDLDDLRDKSLGIIVHTLNEEQRNAWRTATAGVTERLIEQIGGRAREIHALIQQGKAEYEEKQVGKGLRPL